MCGTRPEATSLSQCYSFWRYAYSFTVHRIAEKIVKVYFSFSVFQCAHGRPSVVPLVDLDLREKMT